MARMTKNQALLFSASMLVMLVGLAVDANATGTGLAKVGSQVGDQVGSLNDVVGAIAFVMGLVFGASGLLKFKQHAENPGNTPLMHAVGRLLVAGALVSLPALIGTSVGTMWDTSAKGTTSKGTGLTSLKGY
jgi:Ca2+/Na+ antiporter